MKTAFLVVCVLLLALTMAGCAARANEYENVPVEKGEVAGFWQGLWHGIIFPITFVISLFDHSVGVYDVHNNGGWYNFGFLLGAGVLLGGGGRGSAHRRK